MALNDIKTQLPQPIVNPLPRWEEPEYIDKKTMLLREALAMLKYFTDHPMIDSVSIQSAIDNYYLLALSFRNPKPKGNELNWLRAFIGEKYLPFLWRTDIDIFNTCDLSEFLGFKLLNHDEFIVLRTLAIMKELIY